MFKYELDQVIWYFGDGKVCSAKVLSRAIIENQHDNWNSTDEQKRLFTPFGESGVFYSTCHGTFTEKEVFESKEALKESL